MTELATYVHATCACMSSEELCGFTAVWLIGM